MNLIRYYWNVTGTRFRNVEKAEHYAFDGAIFCTIPGEHLERRRPIIIHLDHPLMHVGDQIFFRPLAWRLKQAGFDVSVTTRPAVGFLFEDIRQADKPPLAGTLVVLRHEAYGHARKFYGSNVEYFVIRQISRGVRRPVANFILEAFSNWFHLDDVDVSVDKTCFLPFSTRPELGWEKFSLPEDRPLVILSNYVDSGLHRKLLWRERAMLRQAAQLKAATGAAVVHVGTARDLERDYHNYSELVDFDLRGRTSVEDLFHLLGAPNVKQLFCFDTAVLHIGYILDAPTTLFVKYYFTRAERQQKADAFYRFFERPAAPPPRSDATFASGAAT
jgi:hypothetical protein